jgi:3-methylcrotonyl-CoA carboxylase alpha subunit
MFTKILIANRGEIAVRVIKTARRMGIRTVAVFSEADAKAMHVSMADEAVYIGPAPASESYLRGDKILEAAKRTGAQAIHPGYGFLSENAAFAAACAEAGVVFIGPPASAILAMGSKSESKRLMSGAHVPLVPGYHEEDQDLQTLAREAEKIGYPVLVKASAGGGGKGMRIVRNAKEFADAVAGAKREAKAAFGDDRLLLEKYLTKPRHIEIQVFADTHGNGVYIFDRDCSIQRRHQKVIEEAPAPGLADDVRRRMGEAAVAAAQAVEYVGAGTVEFLYEDGAFYFIEMNTRLQVEHPVTEMITGLDLVEWQLRVAAGEPLPKKQHELTRTGHAFEARIYAEDPERGFLPAIGRLTHLGVPVESKHVRIDTGVRAGDQISIHYDPMIAKLITWGEDRTAALRHLRQALAQYEVAGVATNVPFLRAIASHEAFERVQFDTSFIERHRAELPLSAPPLPDSILALAVVALVLRPDTRDAARTSDVYSPWNSTTGWRLNAEHAQEVRVLHGEATHAVTLRFKRDGYEVQPASGRVVVVKEAQFTGDVLSAVVDGVRIRITALVQNDAVSLFEEGRLWRIVLDDPLTRAARQEAGVGHLLAPMPGVVVSVLVNKGDTVERDQPLMVIEAMKMEHTITAPHAGRVAEVKFAKGQQVSYGDELLTLEDA